MKVRRPSGRAGLLFLLAVVGLGSCGPRVKTITVDTLSFGPAPAQLRVGDVVEWRNASMLEHTATAVDGSFDVGLPAGKAGRTELRKAGLIRYYCRFHPGMTGELRVQER